MKDQAGLCISCKGFKLTARVVRLSLALGTASSHGASPTGFAGEELLRAPLLPNSPADGSAATGTRRDARAEPAAFLALAVKMGRQKATGSCPEKVQMGTGTVQVSAISDI